MWNLKPRSDGWDSRSMWPRCSFIAGATGIQRTLPNFMVVVYDHVRISERDAIGSSENWYQAFQSMGIDTELANAILDPDFRQIRYTRSAKEWAVDSMKGRFRILTAAEETSRQRDQLRRSEALRKIGGSWSKKNVEKVTPNPRVACSTAFSQHTPGTTTLWIGHDKLRFKPAFPPGESVMMEQMCSAAPSDFCGRPANMLYTALDIEVAESMQITRKEE